VFAANKPVAAVCHAPGALRYVRAPNGALLVDGKKVTGFSNSEEETIGLMKAVPFLVEDMLKSTGGVYSKSGDFQPYVVGDCNLVTGQNPASSAAAANAVLRLLGKSTR